MPEIRNSHIELRFRILSQPLWYGTVNHKLNTNYGALKKVEGAVKAVGSLDDSINLQHPDLCSLDFQLPSICLLSSGTLSPWPLWLSVGLLIFETYSTLVGHAVAEFVILLEIISKSLSFCLTEIEEALEAEVRLQQTTVSAYRRLLILLKSLNDTFSPLLAVFEASLFIIILLMLYGTELKPKSLLLHLFTSLLIRPPRFPHLSRLLLFPNNG